MKLFTVSHAPTPEEADRMREFLTGCRTDFKRSLSDNELRGMALRYAALPPEFTFWMSTTNAGSTSQADFANHAVHCFQLAREEGRTPDIIGLGNEDHLPYRETWWQSDPKGYAAAGALAWRGLRDDGFTEIVAFGSMGNISTGPVLREVLENWPPGVPIPPAVTRKLAGMEWLKIAWDALPAEMKDDPLLACDPHLYPPTNPPPGHASFDAAFAMLREVVGQDRIILMGESGRYQPRSEEQAWSIKNDLAGFVRNAVRAAAVYMWTAKAGSEHGGYALVDADTGALTEVGEAVKAWAQQQLSRGA
jgi:hypothetical protein